MVYILIPLAIIFTISLFILLCRFIGWTLGLSEIRVRTETLIEQMEDLITIQKAIAKSQGIPFKSDESAPK